MASEKNHWAKLDRKCDAWIARAMDSELMSVLGSVL